MEPLTKQRRRLSDRAKRLYRFLFRNPPRYRITHRAQTERHGTDYGGWNILSGTLDPQSIVYSLGVGQDISFDVSIIECYGCKVYAFDPTPSVAVWLQRQILPANLIFQSVAVGVTDGFLDLFEPGTEGVSHHALPQGSSQRIRVPSACIPTLMLRNGHDRIDLLKMDIEGFEYEVLRSMLRTDIRPRQIVVEFHHFFKQLSNRDTEDAIHLLETSGYRLFDVSDSFCEYGFLYVGE